MKKQVDASSYTTSRGTTVIEANLFDNVRHVRRGKLDCLMIHFQLALALHASPCPVTTNRMSCAVPLRDTLDFAVAPPGRGQDDGLRKLRHFLSFSHRDTARRILLRRCPQASILIFTLCVETSLFRGLLGSGPKTCGSVAVQRPALDHGFVSFVAAAFPSPAEVRRSRC